MQHCMPIYIWKNFRDRISKSSNKIQIDFHVRFRTFKWQPWRILVKIFNLNLIWTSVLIDHSSWVVNFWAAFNLSRIIKPMMLPIILTIRRHVASVVSVLNLTTRLNFKNANEKWTHRWEKSFRWWLKWNPKFNLKNWIWDYSST